MKVKSYRIALNVLAARLELYDDIYPRGIPDPLFNELENLIRDLQVQRKTP